MSRDRDAADGRAVVDHGTDKPEEKRAAV